MFNLLYCLLYYMNAVKQNKIEFERKIKKNPF